MINFSIKVYLVINSLCDKSVRGFLKGMLLLFIYSSQLVVLYNSNFVAFLALLRFLCCKTSSNSKSPYALGFVVVTEIIYSHLRWRRKLKFLWRIISWNFSSHMLISLFSNKFHPQNRPHGFNKVSIACKNINLFFGKRVESVAGDSSVSKQKVKS